MDWDKKTGSSWISSLVNRLIPPSSDVKLKCRVGGSCSLLLTCIIAVCMPDIGFPLHGASVIVKPPSRYSFPPLHGVWGEPSWPLSFFSVILAAVFLSFSLCPSFSALSFEMLPLVCTMYLYPLQGKKTIPSVSRALVYRHTKSSYFLFSIYFWDKTKTKQYLLLIILFYTVDFYWPYGSRWWARWTLTLAAAEQEQTMKL